ncbi:MAG: acyltransferase [Actinobacteria bacterium]|nr:acyltransferase [Actinomycetota bacterium]
MTAGTGVGDVPDERGAIGRATRPRIEDLSSATAETSDFRLGYRPALDGIRAIAVGLIMFGHLFWFSKWIGRNAKGTFLGVDIFFVMSGFLLACLLIEERDANGRFSFRGFYERRALRLLPSLFAMLAALIVYSAVTHEKFHTTVHSALWVVLYVANFAMIRDPQGFVQHLRAMWSLAVEEQYYLLFFPALVLLLKVARSRRVVLAVLICGIGLVACWRAWLTFATDPNLAAIYVRTDTRADALLVGPLAAFVVYGGFRPGRRFRVVAVFSALFAAAMLVFAADGDVWVYRYALTPLELSLIVVIVSIVTSEGRVAWLLARRPIVWAGRISYELYIWHYPIYLIVASRVGPGIGPAALAVAASFGCAAACHHLIARPFLASKRRRALAVRGTVGAP